MLKDIQRYWCIFIHTRRHAAKGEGGGLRWPFLKTEKMLWSWKKDPDFVHLWVKFFIQNAVLRVSRRKNSEMFPCCTFSLRFWQNIYRSALVPRNLPYPENYSFCITLHLKFLIVFWTCLCLDNCSVICTVTLCYVLHQTHS